MDSRQLEELVAQGESETLEFKKTTGERRDAMHSPCAMLNHRGGRSKKSLRKFSTSSRKCSKRLIAWESRPN